MGSQQIFYIVRAVREQYILLDTYLTISFILALLENIYT